MIDLSTPAPIKEDFFTKIEKEGQFIDIVSNEFAYEASKAGLKPQYSDDLFQDAYQSYCWDVKRLDDNMDSAPDHFKRCGYLSYWLRRNSPIICWDSDNYALSAEGKEFRDLINKYGRAYHAFSLGYRVCLFFQQYKKSEGKMPSPIDKNYIQDVCYIMKYKNLSPHAMGLVYRSLFFV